MRPYKVQTSRKINSRVISLKLGAIQLSSKVENKSQNPNVFYWVIDDKIGLVQCQLDPGIVFQLTKLPEKAEAYFDVSIDHEMLLLTDLVNTRARPGGILSANKLMLSAFNDVGKPRAPILVQPYDQHRWLVIDGNSTTINALYSGWYKVPCTIE